MCVCVHIYKKALYLKDQCSFWQGINENFPLLFTSTIQSEDYLIPASLYINSTVKAPLQGQSFAAILYDSFLQNAILYKIHKMLPILPWGAGRGGTELSLGKVLWHYGILFFSRAV